MAFITVTGNNTKDAQIKRTNDGSPYCVFGIADNFGKDQVQFFNCTIWGSKAEKLSEYIKKGQKTTVVGRMNTVQSKDDNSQSMMINVIDVQFMGDKKEENQSSNQQNDNQQDNTQQTNQTNNNFDNDIPF